MGSWKWTCWGGAVKREIQIYKTSKKTGKSRGRGPRGCCAESIEIQTAGAIETIIQRFNTESWDFWTWKCFNNTLTWFWATCEASPCVPTRAKTSVRWIPENVFNICWASVCYELNHSQGWGEVYLKSAPRCMDTHVDIIRRARPTVASCRTRGVSLRVAQSDELQTVSEQPGKEWACREASNPLSTLSGWSFHCG